MRLFTTFHQLETMHENYHISTFSPSCYASVKWQNVSQVTLNNKKDTARIVQWKPKSRRLRYPNGTLPTHFLGIVRVTVLLSKCFEKNIIIWLYQTRLHHGRFPKSVQIFFFGTAISQNSSEPLHARRLYLFS